MFWNESYEKVFVKEGDPKDRAKIEASMKRMFAENGHRNMPDNRFKAEKARSVGGKKVQVWAFKSYQLRVYGLMGSVHGKQAFFAVEVDPKKKRDKADPNALVRAAEKGIDFAASIVGSKV